LLKAIHRRLRLLEKYPSTGKEAQEHAARNESRLAINTEVDIPQVIKGLSSEDDDEFSKVCRWCSCLKSCSPNMRPSYRRPGSSHQSQTTNFSYFTTKLYLSYPPYSPLSRPPLTTSKNPPSSTSFATWDLHPRHRSPHW
jgi:hypothetical protein